MLDFTLQGFEEYPLNPRNRASSPVLYLTTGEVFFFILKGLIYFYGNTVGGFDIAISKATKYVA